MNIYALHQYIIVHSAQQMWHCMAQYCGKAAGVTEEIMVQSQNETKLLDALYTVGPIRSDLRHDAFKLITFFYSLSMQILYVTCCLIISSFNTMSSNYSFHPSLIRLHSRAIQSITNSSSVMVDASSYDFLFYNGGIYSDDKCNSEEQNLNHAMLLVGYVDYPEDDSSYWILKNRCESNVRLIF